MRKWILLLLLLPLVASPVWAAEIEAPTAPEAAQPFMPRNTGAFSDGLWELIGRVLDTGDLGLAEASEIAVRIIGAVMVLSVLSVWKKEDDMLLNLCGAAAVAGVMFSGTNSMILLARDTVESMSAYGKLLLPVMTAALAAEGGFTASTGLYMGTAFFDALLGTLLTAFFVPMIYCFLALSTAWCVCREELLQRIRDLLKTTIAWLLKILLTVYTSYMGITGVVSGTTDTALLKATKVTISGMVPVVGGVLSDASEAVLVGTGVMKNAAGIYGIFAILALFLAPFLRIAIPYLVLKLTAALCCVFGKRGITELIDDFASAMGMLLAITGSMCLLLLISTVCFMKGVS